MSEDNLSEEDSQYWDAEAHTFDDEPDHGLREPELNRAWTNLLENWLPQTPAEVLDMGCGTGSLSIVMAKLGHKVTGVDYSAEMIRIAKQKADAANLAIDYQVMDARHLTLTDRQFGVVICRHVLWLMSDVSATLAEWSRLIEPGGRLLLVEGFWSGGGLHAEQVVRAMPAACKSISVIDLSVDAKYWGKVVSDERYTVIGQF